MKTNSNEIPVGEAERLDSSDLRGIYEVVRRKFWRISACALAGMLLGAGYATTRPDVFEAAGTVQVEEENPSVTAIQDVNKEDFRLPEDLKTVEGQLSTRNLVWRVIQVNKFDREPGFFDADSLRKLCGSPGTQSKMIDALLSSLTVKLRRGTRMIDITVRHGNPVMAQTVARSLIDQYAAQNAEWRVNPSKEAGKLLIEEAERLKRKLESAEQSLQEYREKNHAVSLDDKQNIVVERLKNLNLRVAQVQNDTLALEPDRAQLDKIGRQPEKLLAIGSIANTPSVLDIQRVLTEKEAAFVVLRQRYGAENPAYAQAERQVQQVRAALDSTVLNAADSLRARYEAAKFTQQMSEKMLMEQEQLALDLNKKATEYDVLSREVESDRTLFASVLKRLKETGVMQNTSQTNLRVVEPPMLPEVPVGRRKLLIIALGMFFGGALGFGGTIGGYLARPTIQFVDQTEHVLGLPGLGVIPRVSGLGRDVTGIPCIKKPRSQAAEAFRFLIASTSAMVGQGGKGSVLFTGATNADGITSCAVSYAVALAQSGVRTLLMDANFRTPSIGRFFSIPEDGGGLSDCLENQRGLGECVVPTKVDNLFVLAAGKVSPNLSSLFSKSMLGDLIAKAMEEYGQVVIDSAPVRIASETLILARQVSACCIVLRFGRTAVSAACRACELLEQGGRLPIGFILNHVPRRLMP